MLWFCKKWEIWRFNSSQRVKKKRISPEDLERYKREVESLKTIDHPNVIQLYEVYEIEELLYLVMEKCEGGELFDDLGVRLESGKIYSEKKVAIIMKQVMSAIEYCHQKKNMSSRFESWKYFIFKSKIIRLWIKISLRTAQKSEYNRQN